MLLFYAKIASTVWQPLPMKHGHFHLYLGKLAMAHCSYVKLVWTLMIFQDIYTVLVFLPLCRRYSSSKSRNYLHDFLVLSIGLAMKMKSSNFQRVTTCTAFFCRCYNQSWQTDLRFGFCALNNVRNRSFLLGSKSRPELVNLCNYYYIVRIAKKTNADQENEDFSMNASRLSAKLSVE